VYCIQLSELRCLSRPLKRVPKKCQQKDDDNDGKRDSPIAQDKFG